MKFPSKEPACEDSLKQILARIDREIERLLRDGVLSSLDYELPVEAAARTDRAVNLKALLEARRHYRRRLNN